MVCVCRQPTWFSVRFTCDQTRGVCQILWLGHWDVAGKKGSGGWSVVSTGFVHREALKPQLVSCCSVFCNYEIWVLGNRDSGEYLRPLCDFSNIKILHNFPVLNYCNHHSVCIFLHREDLPLQVRDKSSSVILPWLLSFLSISSHNKAHSSIPGVDKTVNNW